MVALDAAVIEVVAGGVEATVAVGDASAAREIPCVFDGISEGEVVESILLGVRSSGDGEGDGRATAGA